MEKSRHDQTAQADPGIRISKVDAAVEDVAVAYAKGGIADDYRLYES